VTESLVAEWDFLKLSAKTMSNEMISPDYRNTHDELLDRALKMITSGMIENDAYFQTQMRGQGYNEVRRLIVADSVDDFHTSLVRKYALHGANSGHEAFDLLFRDVRENMVYFKSIAESNQRGADTYTVGKLIELQEGWERNHPGETFWDTASLKS
jgi:hypothetical protein